MSVAARFYVAEVTKTSSGPNGSGRVVLVAVSRGDQNRAWASATPSGRIEMTINNPPAFKWFEDLLAGSGSDVDILFTAAQIAQPGDGHPYRVSLAQEGTAYGPPYCGDCCRPESEHTT